MTKNKKWSERFEDLKEYKATHGHCEVDEKVDKSLYKWLGTEKNKISTLERIEKGISVPDRSAELSKYIDDDKISKLQGLGVLFVHQRHNLTWKNHIDDFKSFKEKNSELNGNDLIRSIIDKTVPERMQLYKWSMRVQKAYEPYLKENKFGRGIALNESRINELKEIGFPLENTDIRVKGASFAKKEINSEIDSDETISIDSDDEKELFSAKNDRKRSANTVEDVSFKRSKIEKLYRVKRFTDEDVFVDLNKLGNSLLQREQERKNSREPNQR